MPVKTISPDAKGMLYLNCPSCGDLSLKPADQFFNIPQPMHISCTCGNTYEVQIEFRKSFRKKTHLEGFCSKVASPGSFDKTTITDMSIGGCRFLVGSRQSFRKDDRVKLVFNLDNGKSTKITKEAMICSLDKHSACCQFFNTGSGYDPDIGFYLRSK